MSDSSYNMRSSTGAGYGQSSDPTVSRPNWSSERNSVAKSSNSPEYQTNDAWTTIVYPRAERLGNRPQLSTQEQSAFDLLQSENTSLSQAQNAAEQLLLNADIDPISRYKPEILKVLSAHNDWRNIVEFLGALVDYRIDISDLDITNALEGLLEHSEDYVFLAAAQALAQHADFDCDAASKALSPKRKQALEQLVGRVAR